MEEARFIGKLLEWAIGAGIRLLEGDDGPEARRLSAVLPPELAADAEHLRQKRLLASEIELDFEADSVDDEDDRGA